MNNTEQVNTWTPEEVKRFWDYEAQFKDNYFTYQIGSQLVQNFEKYIVEKHVLDYGAGAGFFSEELEKTNVKKFAVLENSPQSVKILRDKFSGTSKFIEAYDPNTILDSSEKFDTVFLFEVIEHLDDEALKEVLLNIKCVLNENGLLIITTPNNEDITKSFVCCPCCGKVFHRWQHVRSWNIESLALFLKKYGFEINQIYTTNLSFVGKRKKQLDLKTILRHPRTYLLNRKKTMDKEPHLVAIVKRTDKACAEL